jgi:hypothetical protein
MSSNSTFAMVAAIVVFAVFAIRLARK